MNKTGCIILAAVIALGVAAPMVSLPTESVQAAIYKRVLPIK
jgi:hypothetical protein